MFVVSYAGNQRSRDAVRQFELGWENAMGDTITRKDKDALKSMSKKTMRANVIIASYQSLQSDIDFFQSVHWQVLIADEVTHNFRLTRTLAHGFLFFLFCSFLPFPFPSR